MATGDQLVMSKWHKGFRAGGCRFAESMLKLMLLWTCLELVSVLLSGCFTLIGETWEKQQQAQDAAHLGNPDHEKRRAC